MEIRSPVSHWKKHVGLVKENILHSTALETADKGIVPAGAVDSAPLGLFHELLAYRGGKGINLTNAVSGLKKRQIWFVIGTAQKLHLLIPLLHLGNKCKDFRMLCGKPFIPEPGKIKYYRNRRISIENLEKRTVE